MSTFWRLSRDSSKARGYSPKATDLLLTVSLWRLLGNSTVAAWKVSKGSWRLSRSSSKIFRVILWYSLKFACKFQMLFEDSSEADQFSKSFEVNVRQCPLKFSKTCLKTLSRLILNSPKTAGKLSEGFLEDFPRGACKLCKNFLETMRKLLGESPRSLEEPFKKPLSSLQSLYTS